MSAVSDMIDEAKQDLLDREAAQMAAMANRWAGVLDELQDSLEGLIEDIQAMQASGITVAPATIQRLHRYESLLVQAERQYGGYAAYASESITAAQIDYMGIGVENGVDAIRTGYANYAPADMPLAFNLLDVEAMEAMAGQAADGTPLADLLMQKYPDWWEVIERELINGVAMGKNPREVAAYLANTLNIPLNDALRIARTEQMRAWREATRLTYETSGQCLGWRRQASKDTRTCIACLMLDGRQYDLRTTLADHPNGRCAMRPIIKGVAEPPVQTGRDWFESLDSEEQKKIMGPGKHDAWQKGKFGLGDLARETEGGDWGGSVSTVPLKDLTTSDDD